MGFSDLGCTGSEIETPHLDQLAQEGILFTHCYNSSRCCPTRASLLTGLYQHEVGYGHMDSDLGFPAYQGRFREGIRTLPQMLQDEGYHTMMLGKWHLGHEEDYHPLARGFDEMYGIPKGGGVYYYPCVGRDRQVYLNKQQVFPDSNWYSTDAFTDYAMEFARAASKKERPFFMYLAYIAPHFPLQAREEDIEKYRGSYSKGYAHYRKQRFQKQKELGIVPAQTPLSPIDSKVWDSETNQKEEDLKMAVYAAQVDRMDQNIGRLIDLLKEEHIFENTLIIFLSDNGGASVELNQFPEARIGSRESWSAYGKSWANVSNTPYRKYKSMTHEGGIITPMIVHWPQGIQQSGVISHAPVHLVDIAPTLLTCAQDEGESPVPLLEGKSLVPLWKGANWPQERSLFFEHMGNQAIRHGDWKLVKRHRGEWELYNLKEDPTELHDLSVESPAKKTELLALYEDWAAKKGVRAWPVKSQP